MNRLVVGFTKCQKMVKTVYQCFPKTKMMSSNVVFCQQTEIFSLLSKGSKETENVPIEEAETSKQIINN